MTWLGVGIACYRLGDLSQAEDALVEANILNNLDAAVWGYLSLVCLQTGDIWGYLSLVCLQTGYE